MIILLINEKRKRFGSTFAEKSTLGSPVTTGITSDAVFKRGMRGYVNRGYFEISIRHEALNTGQWFGHGLPTTNARKR